MPRNSQSDKPRRACGPIAAALLFMVPVLGATAEFTLPPPPCGNEKAPILISGIRTAHGAEVGITYRAIGWGPVTMRAIESGDDQTEEFRRYYNEKVAPQLAILVTNTLLEGPGLKIAPGTYRAGFQYAGDGRWHLTFSTGNPGREDVQSVLTYEMMKFENPFLSMSLIPGKAPDEVQLIILYGPYSATIPLRTAGIPIEVGGETRLPAVGSGTALPGDSRQPSMEPPTDSTAPAAGSATEADSAASQSDRERWEPRAPTPFVPSGSGADR